MDGLTGLSSYIQLYPAIGLPPRTMETPGKGPDRGGTLRLQGLQVRARGMFDAWHLEIAAGRAAEKICGLRNPCLNIYIYNNI